MVVIAPHFDLAWEKRRLCAAVDARRDDLLALSHGIHAHPETAFQEHWAAMAVSALLAAGGLRVVRGIHGLPTAVRATAGPAHGPTVVICCEYDALPGLGHACGHNVIAAAGVGAGLALAPLARRLRRRLTVLGTPAEECGGGKVLLGGRGAFTDAFAVLLVHPATRDLVTPPLRAAATLEATFHGRSAHAAMTPERGRSALDAAVLAHTAVGALRATLSPGEQVNGVINAAGVPNVIPDSVASRFGVRAGAARPANMIAARVEIACRSAAVAVGCRADVKRIGPTYAALRADAALAEVFVANASRLGRTMGRRSATDNGRGGSTDLGNVSQVVPALHPMLAIAPEDEPPHTAGFVRHAIAPAADRAVLDGAKAMAMTVADLWMRPALRRALGEQEVS
jgi:amidohydrolase